MSDAIREIVSTYELPEILVEHITFRISRDQRFLSLGSYGEKYRYIGDLVESYQKDRVLSRAFSLDAQIEGSSRRTLHDVLKSKEGENYERIQGMSIYSATNLAFSFLGDKERELLLKLRERSRNGETNLESLDILAEFLLIKERVGVLAKILEQDKRFRQPERQIVYVNLDSENPFIQWGRRNYNGDPLGYFRRHQDVYGRFLDEGRSALQKFDKGLYLALSKRKSKVENGSEVKQLEIAIAMSRKPVEGCVGVNSLAYLKQNLENFIGLSRKEFRTNYAVLYNALVNTRKLREAYSYLEQLSQENEKINKPKGTRYNPKEIEKILEVHILFKGNAMVASRELGYPSASIKFIWEKYNLKAIGKRSGALTNEDIQQILEAHRIYLGNCRLAARKLKLAHDTVRRHWIDNGLKATGNGVNYIQQKVV